MNILPEVKFCENKVIVYLCSELSEVSILLYKACIVTLFVYRRCNCGFHDTMRKLKCYVYCCVVHEAEEL